MHINNKVIRDIEFRFELKQWTKNKYKINNQKRNTAERNQKLMIHFLMLESLCSHVKRQLLCFYHRYVIIFLNETLVCKIMFGWKGSFGREIDLITCRKIIQLDFLFISIEFLRQVNNNFLSNFLI